MFCVISILGFLVKVAFYETLFLVVVVVLFSRGFFLRTQMDIKNICVYARVIAICVETQMWTTVSLLWCCLSF